MCLPFQRKNIVIDRMGLSVEKRKRVREEKKQENIEVDSAGIASNI